MKKDTVIVTGGSGFIGSQVVKKLMQENVNIIIVDNLSTGKLSNLPFDINNISNNCAFYMLDVRTFIELGLLVECQPKAIFHLAALPRIQPSYEDVYDHFDNNVGQSVLLIEHLLKNQMWDTKFIYSGSSAIYGNATEFPTTEEAEKKPLSPYAFQKLEVEKYLELLSDRYKDLKWISLRYFNPYGPNSYNPENKFAAYSSVIGIFDYQHKHGKPLQITGDGTQQRDFIHVEDVANANIAAYKNFLRSTSYNVGTGKTFSINDIAHSISDNIIYIPRRVGEANITHACIDKAKNELNWEPQIKLEIANNV